MRDVTRTQMIVRVKQEFDLPHEDALRLVGEGFDGDDDSTVPIEDFLIWLDEMGSVFGRLVHRTDKIADARDKRSFGGSKSPYDWDRIWEEALLLAAEGRVSEIQTSFFGDIRVRMEAAKVNCPADEAMRRRLGPVHTKLLERNLTQDRYGRPPERETARNG